MTLTAGQPLPAGDLETDLETLIQAQLDALAWSDWSPTYANLTTTSATITARYRQVGDTVEYVFSFVLGASSAVSTGPTFTLPVAAASHYTTHLPVGIVSINDSGTGRWEGWAYVLSGSTATMYYATEAGAGSGAGITSTAPMTWTTGDSLNVWGRYEAA